LASMSSLKEAYYLAHTAQCRLQLEASRPERNLRFVVGHLMHYESLRLRIVEIEHDISRSQSAKAVQFRGTGHVDPLSHPDVRHKPSTGPLRRRSPPPPPAEPDSDEDGDEEEFDVGLEDGEDGLGLTRFPSGASRPPRLPPDLEPDDGDEDDDDDEEPVSPEEPDRATLEQALQGESNELLTSMYEGIRKCRCHGKLDVAPQVERMWALPGSGKDGVTRAVAQVVE